MEVNLILLTDWKRFELLLWKQQRVYKLFRAVLIKVYYSLWYLYPYKSVSDFPTKHQMGQHWFWWPLLCFWYQLEPILVVATGNQSITDSTSIQINEIHILAKEDAWGLQTLLCDTPEEDCLWTLRLIMFKTYKIICAVRNVVGSINLCAKLLYLGINEAVT